MMPVPSESLKILMYHSISSAPGPTSISRSTFSQQLEALAECGHHAVTLEEAAAWHRGEQILTGSPVVITFDDGFADFATEAAPELEEKSWTATVFLPTGRIGGADDWEARRAGTQPRPLMTWATIKELDRRGFDFAAHGVNHADLTTLPLESARDEIVHSKRIVEEKLECQVSSFAPPFGKVNGQILNIIGANFDLSVGTTLAMVTRGCDIHNLPRIDMHYYRDMRRWRAFLLGRGGAYLTLRRSLRKLRQLSRT